MLNGKRIGLGFGMLLASACSGEQLIGDSTQTTKVLNVEAVHHGTPDEDGNYPDYVMTDGTKQFQNAAGVTITLRQAALSWGHLTLISDGNDPDCAPGRDTELHLERVENFVGEDLDPLTLTTEEITDVAYCRYEIQLRADNEMSPGLDAVPDAEGFAVYVAGDWTNGADSGTFAIGVTENILIPGMFMVKEGEQMSPHPLHYHDAETLKTIVFGNKYDHWFDDLDFQGTEAEQDAQLRENVMQTLHQHLGATHRH